MSKRLKLRLLQRLSPFLPKAGLCFCVGAQIEPTVADVLCIRGTSGASVSGTCEDPAQVALPHLRTRVWSSVLRIIGGLVCLFIYIGLSLGNQIVGQTVINQLLVTFFANVLSVDKGGDRFPFVSLMQFY